MTQKIMPRGIAGSPVAVLTAPIDADDTYIPFNTAILADGNVGICTISTSPTVFESVWYTSKDSGGVYTTDGGQRGFDGTTARSWSAGAEVARYVSAYDLDAYADNIEDHEDRIATLESTPATHTLNDLTDVVITGTPADKEVVRYDTSTSKFVNEAIVPADIGAADATGHAHATSWTTGPTFTRTSDSTFTVTDNAANQEIFRPGRPIRYADTVGTYRYGVVTDYTTGTVTHAGIAMTTSFDAIIEYSNMSNFIIERLFIPGSYEAGTLSMNLLTDMGMGAYRWRRGQAYLVYVGLKTEVADSASNGKINIFTVYNYIGYALMTPPGLTLTNTEWVHSTTGNGFGYGYEINFDERIDITMDAGTNKDAEDLTVLLGFVLL